MWELIEPAPVKLIIGILASGPDLLEAAVDNLTQTHGPVDLKSPTWHFTQTDYYNDQIGTDIIRAFIAFEKLIDPAELADIKIAANKLEQTLADTSKTSCPRPVNIDPGYIEPSKLVLASTKNFAHRIYIGKKIWAEVTLTYSKSWQSFPFTFPDFKQPRYHEYLNSVRTKLATQLRQLQDKL